ncbi:MAG: oligosaccharide flippase family protein [Porphyrobacter sp.]|nr:oligosaccharide flippase family protein [Porphyrobacter sp.]
MRINKNMSANYASRLWAGLSSFVFLPLYLRILGPEAFGLVTFSASVLGLLFIVDMGISNAFAREMARETQREKLADLLRSLESVYLGIVLVVTIVAVLASGPIADHWLNASNLGHDQVRWSVALMLIAAVLQVMMSLYIGALLGSNRHVEAAKYQIGFGLVRSGVVLVPLYFQPVVELVFAWQLGASLIGLLLLRKAVWGTIRPHSPPHFSSEALHGIRGFAGGMFGIALISAINTQSDRLVVSKIFSLDELGSYSLAALIGQIPSMLALPLAVTVLPRLTGHVTQGQSDELTTLYMRYSFMVSFVAFSAALGVIVGAPHLLTLLKGSAPSDELVMVARVLAGGAVLLAAQFMPYHLAIASGHTRTSLILGSLSAIFMPMAMFASATHLGLVGVALPWLVMNGIAAIFLAWYVTPQFLGHFTMQWAWKCNLIPMLLSAMTILPLSLIANDHNNPLTFLAILALICGTSLAVNSVICHYLFPEKPENQPLSIDITS